MLDSATITIQGDPYVLRFPLKNMVKAEKILGRPLTSLFTPTKDDATGKMVFPDYTIEQLIILFKLGLSAEYPEIDGAKAEKLFSDFLSGGATLYVQMTLLYTILGKALGFFRTEIDIQQTLSQTLETTPQN